MLDNETFQITFAILGGLAWIVPLWLVFRRDKKVMKEYEAGL